MNYKTLNFENNNLQGRLDIVRRKNGPRSEFEDRIVSHLVGQRLTPKRIAEVVGDLDREVKTYSEENFPIAVANCFEGNISRKFRKILNLLTGDEIVLFPGVYDLTDMLFHESITIRGAGESPDDVVLLAEANESSFVFADAENVTFRNLTFEARRNSDGAVVVNGGKCTIDSCILNCDEG